jgi:hypothetical protein
VFSAGPGGLLEKPKDPWYSRDRRKGQYFVGAIDMAQEFRKRATLRTLENGNPIADMIPIHAVISLVHLDSEIKPSLT